MAVAIPGTSSSAALVSYIPTRLIAWEVLFASETQVPGNPGVALSHAEPKLLAEAAVAGSPQAVAARSPSATLSPPW